MKGSPVGDLYGALDLPLAAAGAFMTREAPPRRDRWPAIPLGIWPGYRRCSPTQLLLCGLGGKPIAALQLATGAVSSNDCGALGDGLSSAGLFHAF